MPHTKETTQLQNDHVSSVDVLENLQFGLWTAVVLIPILYYINGPAVSNDQWYMRAGLIAVAYTGAPLITLIRRRKSGDAIAKHSVANPSIETRSSAVRK